MSATAEASWGKRETRLTQMAARRLAPSLEHGERVWLATEVDMGSPWAYLAIVWPLGAVGLVLLYQASDSLSVGVFFLACMILFMTSVTVAQRWGMKRRVLVLTDRRFLLCRTDWLATWMLRPPGRIELEDRREAVRVEGVERHRRRITLTGPDFGQIKPRLRPGYSPTTVKSIQAWAAQP